MRIEDCFQVGYFAKTHGLQGALVMVLDVDDPAEYEELDSFFVAINGKLVPYFVESLQLQRDKAVVSLEDVDTLEKAHSLVGCALYLPLDNLPKLQEGQFYYHEIVGYQIVDKHQGKLGIVSAVYELPHQDLIAMQYKGKEVLIPINNDIVGPADHEAKEIAVNLPEGLVEIYLDDTGEEGSDDATDEEDTD
jgi:16S rRNA processing protein RimM